jgi:putative FmdB family regulatory protein
MAGRFDEEMAQCLDQLEGGPAMPTYEYECADCGPFNDVRPMAEYDQPQPCPDCDAMAPRLLTVAAIGGGASAPRPGVAPAAAHPGGCGCCAAPRRLSAEAV